MGVADLKQRLSEKRTPCSEEHDQICRYVKRPEVLLKIATVCGVDHACNTGAFSRTEVLMLRVSGRYSNPIGYADLLFSVDRTDFIVEVKSGKIVVGEVLRQLRSYEQAQPARRYRRRSTRVDCHRLAEACARRCSTRA
jgi:hypothetical protein